jgi:3-oxoadipate enol-lactonase
MPTAEINGIEIHYTVDGEEDAPPLLFSNSLGTDLGMWDGQVPELAGSFRIVRYDSRGHGQSSAPAGNYSLDQLGRDAVALLDHLEIEKTAFCGLSKGGMVGQWLGIHAPERVSRLVLSNTSSHIPTREMWDGRIATVTEGGMEAITQTVLERWFTPGFLERNPGEANRIRDMLLNTPPQGYAGCCAAIRDMDIREEVSAIRIPTLVIIGEKDPATTPEQGELIAKSVKGATLTVISDAAHLSNVEQPEQYMKALKGFLAE